MSFLRNGGKKTVFFVISVALFACVLSLLSFCAARLSLTPANADKETYVFDYSKFFYRRNAADVAFYYDGEFDPSISLIIQDEEGIRYPEEFGVEGLVGTAQLTMVRAEDDRYQAFTSTIIPLTQNTDLDVAIMPIGQRRLYDGTETTYAIATFTQGGIDTQAFRVGEYLVALAYETPIEVPYYIEKAQITASPTSYTRRYLDAGQPTEIVVEGAVSQSDLDYIRANLVLTCEAQDDSVPGEYPITLVYNGDSVDYDVLLEESTFTIQGALLDGFTFSDAEYLYDGKTHDPIVSYDHDRWPDVSISYDLTGLLSPGKYRVTATIRKEYYVDNVLQADLTILATKIETSSATEYASIEGSENGFDPTVSIVLRPYEYNEEDENIMSLLAEKDGYKSVIVSSYSVVFSEYVPGKFTLKMRPSTPTSASGVTLMRYDGTEITTVEYTYENGYFVVETEDYDGFLFVRKVHVTHTSISDIVVAAIIGAVVLLILIIVLSSSFKNSKKRSRSRRRHARWA